jgi:hypothetical protein
MDEKKKPKQVGTNMERRGFVKTITAGSFGAAMFGTSMTAEALNPVSEKSGEITSEKKKVFDESWMPVRWYYQRKS